MKGICFKPHLHELTVQGVKNQTRRIIISRTGYFQVCSKNGVITNIWQTDADEWTGDNLIPVKPRYNVGEALYLKEPYIDDSDMLFTAYPIHETLTYGDGSTLYQYGNDTSRLDSIYGDKVKWENKLFMPSKYARTFIEITAVRAERLQDISDEDCIREGILSKMDNCVYLNGIDNVGYLEPKDAYASLINAINGKGTWDSNPYVWVYDYELVQPHSPL